MLEKISKNQKVKLIGSFVGTTLLGLFVVLVIFVYLNSTYGWFANNREVGGTGMTVTVEAMQAEAEYFAYIYDVKAGTVKYTGDTTITDPTQEPRVDNLIMQFHDTIFQQRNRYTPAIVRIRLTNLKAEWLNGGIVNVTIGRNTDTTNYPVSANPSSGTGKLLTEFFSSIMRFTLAQDQSWYDLDDANADEPDEMYFNLDNDLYEGVKALTSDTDSSKVFTSITLDNENLIDSISKVDSITLKCPYTAADIDEDDGYIDIYLYITYDEELTYAYEHRMRGLNTETTVLGNLKKMVNDLTSLVVSFERTPGT